MPFPIFCIKTANNLTLNYEIDEFLSEQYYEVTKNIVDYNMNIY